MDAYRQGRSASATTCTSAWACWRPPAGTRSRGGSTFKRQKTRKGTFSYLEAGQGDPILLLHGLGGTKASFLPTVSALAGDYRMIALDHLGFGESDKPIAAPYDAGLLRRRRSPR